MTGPTDWKNNVTERRWDKEKQANSELEEQRSRRWHHRGQWEELRILGKYFTSAVITVQIIRSSWLVTSSAAWSRLAANKLLVTRPRAQAEMHDK